MVSVGHNVLTPTNGLNYYFILPRPLYLSCTRWTMFMVINTIRSKKSGRHFSNNIFKFIFLRGLVSRSVKISAMFIPKCSLDKKLALVQVMALHRTGHKPLPESMINRFFHVCIVVTRPYLVTVQLWETTASEISTTDKRKCVCTVTDMITDRREFLKEYHNDVIMFFYVCFYLLSAC